MTTSSDPAEGTDTIDADAAPYLPSARPTATGTVTPPRDFGTEPAASTLSGATSPTSAVAEMPFVPARAPVVVAEPEPIVFDAKAMVDSQKRYNAKPAYGALPTGTEASRDAAKKLKAKAQRKRARNKRIGWFVGVLFLGGVGAAGWFGYQAYQDEQDQRAIELAEAQNDDAPRDADLLGPLGEQVEVIGAQDAVNSGATGGAGALLDAVDDARAVVGETSPSGSITLADVLPPVVVEIGERLPDATGRDTYIVDADQFASADPAAFGRFVRLLVTQPQTAPGAPAIAGLPPVTPQQIVISLERDGDVLQRAIVVGLEVGINVDYRP